MSQSSQSVQVRVNGALYRDFTRLYIRISLDEICPYLEMEVNEQGRREIGKHDTIRVEYLLPNGEPRPVVTVQVDRISRLLNAQSKTYRVTARSLARNILDSAWSERLRGLTLYQIVQRIAQRFDLDAANFAGATGQIAQFEWEAESPWQKLQTAALAQGCILYSSQLGGIYLNRVSGTPRTEGFQLSQNKNIEELILEENGQEHFYRYEVIGNSGKAVAIDTTCPVHSRVLQINMPDESMSSADLRRWAYVQRNRRRSDELKVRLTGWGLDNEELAVLVHRAGSDNPTLYGLEILWGVNFYVPVTAPEYDIENRYYLTTGVEFTVEQEAISSNLTLKPREDYLGA